MRHKSPKAVVIVALLANLLIAVSKFAVFMITNSSSLFSEAIHSTADTVDQILLLIGMKKAAKSADTAHPFGYGKEQFFYAFIVAIFLFFAGGLYSFIEGINKLKHPHNIEQLPYALGLLIISMILEGISFFKAKREIAKLKGNISYLQFIKKSYRVELIVVFFEDFAALVGLSIAFLFVLLSYVLNNAIFDGIGSILIGILLMVISIVIAKEMESLIIGEAIPKKMKLFIIQALKSHKEVKTIKDFKSMVLGEESILVAIEVVFDSDINTEKIREIIDSAESKIIKEYPEIKHIFIEPHILQY